MGNNACGMVSSRKAQSKFSSDLLLVENEENRSQSISINKSLYIEQLSQADNRNIKKLYSIMNLSRTPHTLATLTSTLLESFKNLSDYHANRYRRSSSAMFSQPIEHVVPIINSAQSTPSPLRQRDNDCLIKPISEASSYREESLHMKKKYQINMQRVSNNYQTEKDDQSCSNGFYDQVLEEESTSVGEFVNMQTVEPYSDKFEHVVLRVVNILQEKESTAIKIHGNVQSTFNVRLEQFFYLFRLAASQLQEDEREITRTKMLLDEQYSKKYYCCTTRQRKFDDDLLIQHKLEKKNKWKGEEEQLSD